MRACVIMSEPLFTSELLSMYYGMNVVTIYCSEPLNNLFIDRFFPYEKFVAWLSYGQGTSWVNNQKFKSNVRINNRRKITELARIFFHTGKWYIYQISIISKCWRNEVIDVETPAPQNRYRCRIFYLGSLTVYHWSWTHLFSSPKINRRYLILNSSRRSVNWCSMLI